MKTEKNIRKGFGLADKIAMFCIGLVSLVLTSCESELEIQQSYPFTVETMPVPKELNRNETAEIRCELKSEGDFDGTVYTIRYFQYDGEGSLKLDNGFEFKPNGFGSLYSHFLTGASNLRLPVLLRFPNPHVLNMRISVPAGFMFRILTCVQGLPVVS